MRKSGLCFDKVRPTIMVLRNQRGDTVFRINTRDGSIGLNPKYTLDEAAKRFWEAVARHAPGVKV